MDYSKPDFPILRHLLHLAQTHVHGVSDTMQPFHPPSPPSCLAFNLSQHQGLFLLVSSSHQVAEVFELQHQSFQLVLIFRTDFLYDGLVWSPCSPKDSQESSPTPQYKRINSPVLSLLNGPALTSIHDYWTNHKFDIWTFVNKVMPLLFDILYRFVIAFLPRSMHVLISWLQLPSTVILEPRKIKPITVSIISPSIRHEVTGPDALIFIFWMLSFNQIFHSPFQLHQEDP